MDIKEKNMKKEIIKLIEQADIKEDDWHEAILEKVTNDFARGYLTAMLGTWNGMLSCHDEEFQEQFIKYCHWNIWK